MVGPEAVSCRDHTLQLEQVMTRKQFEGIIVNRDLLTQAVAYGTGDKCLDFVTGEIVLTASCAEADIGEARPGLKQGKRFIRIPMLDDLQKHFKTQYDEFEFGGHLDNDDVLPKNPQAEEMRELLRPLSDEIRQSTEYRESCELLHGDLAGEEAAMKWIEGLRPEVMIGWFEDGFGVKRVYDPAAKDWVDA